MKSVVVRGPFGAMFFANGFPVPQIASAARHQYQTNTPSIIGDMCISVIGYGLHRAGTVH